jgi:hypothetical protein
MTKLYTIEDVQLIIKEAKEEEREENAKLCNSLARWHGQLVTAAFDHAADSIRYKGEQTSTNEQDEQLRARSTYYGNNP